MPVEKGTKPVISANFCGFAERKFNNLHTEFSARKGLKGVFQQPQDFATTRARSLGIAIVPIIYLVVVVVLLIVLFFIWFFSKEGISSY